MMKVSDIFDGAEPMLGETEPIFGGARLPNDREANNRGQSLEWNPTLLGQLTRRAVGTNVRQLFYLNSFGQFGSLQTWHTLGQRLGGFWASIRCKGSTRRGFLESLAAVREPRPTNLLPEPRL